MHHLNYFLLNFILWEAGSDASSCRRYLSIYIWHAMDTWSKKKKTQIKRNSFSVVLFWQWPLSVSPLFPMRRRHGFILFSFIFYTIFPNFVFYFFRFRFKKSVTRYLRGMETRNRLFLIKHTQSKTRFTLHIAKNFDSREIIWLNVK